MKLRVKMLKYMPKIVLISKNAICVINMSLQLKNTASITIAQTIIRN